MFLRSAVRYLSYTYLLKLLIDKTLSGKVRFVSVVIEKDFLSKLADDPKFKSLLFSSDYDNRPVIKDKVTLLGYILEDTPGSQLKRRPLEVLDKGEVFDNERNYSRYELKIEDLRKLLDASRAEVRYFIFSPIPYPPDREYVAYRILPADRDKMPFKRKQEANTLHQPVNSASEKVGAQELQTNAVVMASRTAFEFEVAGVLNPSPPATSDVDF